MSTVIKVENLSKIYKLGEVTTGTITQDFNRWFAKVRGKEDPFLKIGQVNDRTASGTKDFVYSLRNISFDVQQGDTLAIVGRNGAGKSTLLKILSRITSPSTGSAKIKGRVASLLEVGTGFNPELTGKDNIFLNGAILGMRKHEIRSKLDEIIDFSGVDKYIDTPVKRYSSGMYVRLAFAVAAHLEPEILIVDEVLAVGDAEFQKKCLGKMKDVSGQGRTVLFVSHNMAAVKSLCEHGILLRNGELVGRGTSQEIVAQYMGMGLAANTIKKLEEPIVADDVTVSEIGFRPPGGKGGNTITEGEGLELYVKYRVNNNAADRYHFTFHLHDDQGEVLFGFTPGRDNESLRNGDDVLICRFPDNFLNVGSYFLAMLIVKDKKQVLSWEKDITTLTVSARAHEMGDWMGREPGFLVPSFRWEHQS